MQFDGLARGISAAGHPLVLIPVVVALTTGSLTWTLAIAATTVAPLLLITFRNVRRRTWSDVDVSRHDQRSGLYAWAVPLLVVAAGVLYLTGASPRMLQSVGAAAGMLVVGVAGNRLLKISLHLMFAGFGGVLLLELHPHPAVAFAITIAVIAIAWSRWHLRRHTPVELVVGLLLGIAGGVVAVL